MLKQRIITAVVLLALLLPALFYPDSRAFMLVAGLLIAAGTWEWANLNQCDPGAALACAGLMMVACVAAAYFGLVGMQLPYFWIIVGSVWVLGGVWLLRGGVGAWGQVPRSTRVVVGFLALAAAWLAVVQARIMGVNFLISSLVLVWIADIAAYFTGRAMGGRFFKFKLASTISPGKTWEGALGGLFGVLVGALVWRYVDAFTGTTDLSIFTRLAQTGVPYLLLAVGFLAAMSVVGDLVESLFKRSAGVKDSSGLLPGHGGVLDRLDALLPVLPLVMMLTSL
jgi:phosphatidate cytidylyltransferase